MRRGGLNCSPARNWKQPLMNNDRGAYPTGPPPLRPVVIGDSGRPIPLFQEPPVMLPPPKNHHHPVNGNRVSSFDIARIGAGVVKRNAHGRHTHRDNNQGFQQHQKNQLKKLKDRLGGPVQPILPSQEYEQSFDLDRYHETPSHETPAVTIQSSSSPSKGTKRHPIVLEDDAEVGVPEAAKKPRKDDYKSRLSHEMTKFYHRNIQTIEVLHSKRDLCNRLFEVARAAAETQYACNMFLVGSTLNGCASKSSDADLCLYLPNTDIDRKRTLMLLEKLRNRLQRSGQFIKIQLIRAKVPILKFFDRITGFECDLNINNSVGIRNTHLLKAYSLVDERMAQLMFAVKYWARYCGINDASCGTFNSYSLALMVIFYLQVGVTPPIAPVLQRDEKELFSLDLEVEQLPRFDQIPQKYRSSNPMTVGELFVGFIKYFTSVFRFGTDIASIRTGKIIKRSTMDDDPQWSEKYICIEEPFDRSNTARAVYSQDKFNRIVDTFGNALKRIERERTFDCFSVVRS